MRDSARKVVVRALRSLLHTSGEQEMAPALKGQQQPGDQTSRQRKHDAQKPNSLCDFDKRRLPVRLPASAFKLTHNAVE